MKTPATKIRLCTRCGKDCGKYGHEEFLGQPYHAGCLPDRDTRREMAREWVKAHSKETVER